MQLILKKLRLYKAKLDALSFPYQSYHKKHNCIFIHIPKVAGTSVLNALGKKHGRRDHLPWYVYNTADPYYYENAFKFAFVRNPWCRTLSAYTYLYNGGNKKGDSLLAEQVRQYNSFDDFVIKGLHEGHFRNHLLFIPQSEFVLNGDGDYAVDFLGRYESLNDDFGIVSEKLQLNTSLPNINQSKSQGTSYRDAYTKDKAIEAVKEIYKQDATVFGYDF